MVMPLLDMDMSILHTDRLSGLLTAALPSCLLLLFGATSSLFGHGNIVALSQLETQGEFRRGGIRNKRTKKHLRIIE